MQFGATTNLPPYAELLGIKIVSVSKDKIVAEMPVTPSMANINGSLHGGALLSLADQVAGMGARQNVTATQGTVTVESKTNFLSAIAIGDIARAECTALHVGRTTSVWQTRITRGDGKLAGVCTQTQLVIEKKA